MARVAARLRATGADPPFGDPRGHHGVALEGYFWRFTDPPSGRVVVVLLGISRDAGGAGWGTVALASHPGGFVRSATLPRAGGHPHRLQVAAQHADGTAAVRADARTLAVDLGVGATLRAEVEESVPWPRRAFGGSGPAQVVPGLSQYWHPWLLGGRVRGSACLGGEEVGLDGARAYAEKNWGAGGFPDVWWWGHAQAFSREDVCVAFAGGRAGVGPLRALATSVVVRVDDEVVRLTRPPGLLDVRADHRGWRIRGRTARHALELEGTPAGTPAHRLPVPVPRQRREIPGGSAQHLAGELRVRLRRGGRTILYDTSPLAGLELGRGS